MQTMEKISPRVDIAFKKIFGVEENKDLLISLINSIVDKEDRVAEVTLLNPYNLKNFRKDKLSILDIKAKSEAGKRYNIEIQITDDADYDRRALYYWARLYTEQLEEGNDYRKLHKAIGIHILHFVSIPEIDKYHNVFHVTERESGLPYFTDLELHTIELKKFVDDPDLELLDLVAKVKNSLDMWVAFLTRHDLLNKGHLPRQLDYPELKKALNVLDRLHFAPEEREAYEEHLKWLRAEESALRKCKEEGRQEGLEKGLAEGLAKGLAEGLEKGRKEGEEEGEKKGRLATALSLLQMGLPMEQILKATELTRDEIENLISQCEKQS